MTAPRSWDVFCRVIDNFGDAAVCWRLARSLSALPEAPAVRLFIDSLQTLCSLVPQLDPRAARQSCAGVEVLHLPGAAGEPADVAVDGFGGGLPEAYLDAMARREPKPLWIVLEYLSAEPWVASRHGLPSPHPRLPLARYFFFPGFGPDTGGLLREPDLDARRAAFLADVPAREALWRDAGFEPPEEQTLATLFGYESAPVSGLLQAWSAGPPLVAAVPASRISEPVARFMGASTDFPLAGRAARRGSLEVRFLPFLPQDRYDELLWLADWNFVRGEDSFLRAQWADRPFVWQLYPQENGAHLVKLEAFLERYCVGLEPALAAPLTELSRTWNGAPGSKSLAQAWLALSSGGEALRRHAGRWAAVAAAGGDLAIRLARFCSERLK